MTRSVSKRHDDATIIQICELREKGWSVGQLSVRFGIPAGTVSWHCTKAGAEPPTHRPMARNIRSTMVRNGKPVRPFSEADDTLLRELNGAGATHAEMSRRLDRCNSSIRNRLLLLARHEARREAGLERRQIGL